MVDNIEENTNGTSAAKWETNFKVFYGLTDDAVQKLTNAQGSLRKLSGEALTVKMFTRELLMQDPDSKQEMYNLIAKGLLGGVDENGHVHFREDIARLLDDNQSFAVIAATDSDSTINAKVVAVSEESYSIAELALEILGAASQEAATEPEAQDKHHPKDVSPQTKPHFVNEAPTSNQPSRTQRPTRTISSTVRRNLAEHMNEQLSAQREKRQERRREEKFVEKKHEQKVRLRKEIAEKRNVSETVNIEKHKDQARQATESPAERPKYRQFGTSGS